jgi:MFS superfamily sulfate permease-like transporter
MTRDRTRTDDTMARWLPATTWIAHYQRVWLRPDLLAALTVWALLVPEAMAYASMAGMPPEFGLYSAIGALVG